MALQLPAVTATHHGLSPAQGNAAFGCLSPLSADPSGFVAPSDPREGAVGAVQEQELLLGLCWISAVGFGAVIPG